MFRKNNLRNTGGIDFHPTFARTLPVVEIPIGDHGACEVVMNIMRRTMRMTVNYVGAIFT